MVIMVPRDEAEAQEKMDINGEDLHVAPATIPDKEMASSAL